MITYLPPVLYGLRLWRRAWGLLGLRLLAAVAFPQPRDHRFHEPEIIA